MKILFITVGFAPYTFSESLCNSKLVLAMMECGWSVDVISRMDDGRNYSTDWTEPWTPLKNVTHVVEYKVGNKIERTIDVIKSAIKMEGFVIEGIRWAAHAYDLACQLCKEKEYDVIITRSPSDIPHIVGYKLSQKTGIKWISNWNDPATTIWPEPYTHHLSNRELRLLRKYERLCLSNADAITYPAETLGAIFKKAYSFLRDKLCMEIPHIALVDGISFLPIKNAYLTYHNYQECEDAIRYIATNREDVEQKTLIAYKYVQEQHNWEKNMKLLQHIICADYE